MCVSGHAKLSSIGHAPLGRQRVPYGKTSAPNSQVQETQFSSPANPGPQEEKTATNSPIIGLNSPIIDLGLRQAAFTQKDLDHAVEIASGLNHRPLGKTTANPDHTIETSQARPIDQPSSSQARTSLYIFELPLSFNPPIHIFPGRVKALSF